MLTCTGLNSKCTCTEIISQVHVHLQLCLATLDCSACVINTISQSDLSWRADDEKKTHIMSQCEHISTTPVQYMEQFCNKRFLSLHGNDII